ncbi:hypothetical protein QEG73_23345 [Chitinophagaceae bacterium 26-R-25]|nr:hypothetical protein [Chitinophagaceae bacterium 26-R-25]
MKKEIEELKKRFRTADRNQLAAIDKEMDELSTKDPVAFSKAMVDLVIEANKKLVDILSSTPNQSIIDNSILKGVVIKKAAHTCGPDKNYNNEK